MKLGLQLFDAPQNGNMLADWSGLARGVKPATSLQGFDYMPAFIPLPQDRALYYYDLALGKHLKLAYGPESVWEGRVEDVVLDRGGLEIGALGYWRAFSDVPYTALWSQDGYADYKSLTIDDFINAKPELFEADNNNRLYITPRNGETFAVSDRFSWAYRIPNNSLRNIRKIEYTYEFKADTNWRFIVTERNATWGWVSNLTYLDGNGSTQSGTTSQSFNNAAYAFELRANNALSPYTGATNNNYLKVTAIRAKTTTSTNVYADEIIKALIDYIYSVNSGQISNNKAFIQSPLVDLQREIYEDRPPAEIMLDLAGRGDNQTPPRKWDIGVWNNQQVHFVPRYQGELSAKAPPSGIVSRIWYTDLVSLSLNGSLDTLFNSVYAIYQDRNSRTLRTTNNTDAQSVSKYGLTRRGVIKSPTTSATQAGIDRDLYLDQNKEITPRATVEMRGLYDGSGARYPLFMARAGDILVVRNLPVTTNDVIDKIRQFYIIRTEYDVENNILTPTPEMDMPGIEFIISERFDSRLPGPIQVLVA